MRTEIVGYIVVRLPWASEHEYGPVPIRVNSRGETIAYRGIARMPWEEAELEYFSPRQTRVSELYRQMNKNNKDLTGIDVCLDWDAARVLLQDANANGVKNELIAVRSLLLEETKGSIVHEGPELEWLGLDAYNIGECSLIGQGVFRYPSLFVEELDLLNANGLVGSKEDGLAMNRRYRELEEDDLVEPIGSEVEDLESSVSGVGVLDMIEVAAVRLV